ncbi:hypothetical protein [Streptomyces sp. NRRL B-3229]|uniref:hypothetical protein n=1 Tax=Streptomyces sp. NRRL B-3229 TaxID=1463836 RepID=UPI0004C25AD8|nr:hypothetical protein [Streptomyces sp. NRRL B-3229]
MNSRTDRVLGEGGRNDPEQLLDQLLARHRTQLTSTVTNALDTDTGSTALAPLRRELFHGLKPLKLAAPTGCTANDRTPETNPPLPPARLQDVLTQLRDIRLMVEQTCADADVPTDLHTRSHSVITALQRLHAGLQGRNLTQNQVRALFRELAEQTAHIGTSMLGQRTQLPRHIVEQWLRTTGSLQGIERTALRLFRDADDSVPTQG